MAWFDQVGDGIASFRGVQFILNQASQQPGRRVEVHEYPLRDDPYAEDLGRKARTWTLEGTLVGEDYDLTRNRLVDAVEQPGAGELVHPYYGTHQVVVTDCRIRESTREGGMARVSLTVVQAEDEPSQPTVATDTTAVVEDRAGAARQTVLDDFLEKFEILDLATDRVDQVEAALQDALRRVEDTVGGITDPVARLIRSPAELAAQVTESIASIRDLITEPGRAMGIYDHLFRSGTTAQAQMNAPRQSQQQAQAQTAAIRLVRRSAAIEAAVAGATWNYPTRQDAQGTLDTVHSGLTVQVEADTSLGNADGAGVVEANPDPLVVQAITALRSAAVIDIRARGAALPELGTFTPGVTEPALVLAQRLYADASRAADIVARNRIRHPGAVPGGTELEVLNG